MSVGADMMLFYCYATRSNLFRSVLATGHSRARRSSAPQGSCMRVASCEQRDNDKRSGCEGFPASADRLFEQGVT